ncbi:MAG: nucleotidyltransferase family protein [Caldilineaceae bacterium]
MGSNKEIQNLLLDSLRHTPPHDLAERLEKCSITGWQALVALAVEQQVAALLYHRLKTHNCEAALPSEIRQLLQKSHRVNASRNMQIYHALGQLLAALQKQQIPVLVLKGAHLGATVYESIALRSMVDMDILVQEANIMTAVEQLHALGYQPETPWRSLDAYLTYRHHVPPFIHPNKVPVIELHWQVTPPNRGYAIPVEQLWSHRRAAMLNGISAEGLCPEDLLIHVCVHATYHHWFQHGVRSLCDIAELLRYYGDTLDWETVRARAAAWQCERGVYLALSAAQQLLGVDIPNPLVASLYSMKPTPFTRDELQGLLFPEQRASIVTPDSYFWSFLHKPTLASGVRSLRERLFLSPKEMATKYAIGVNSPWLYYYYGVRFKDLLGKFALKTWRVYFGDPNMMTMVKQQERLQQWLAGSKATP